MTGANPARGEIAVVVDGEEYILKITMDAAIKAQQRTKKTLGELNQAAGRTDVEAIRELLWIMVQEYHADKFKQPRDVAPLWDWFGGPQAFWDYVNGIALYQESIQQPDTQGVGAGNPPRAQAGTGDASKSSPASAV